MNLLSKIRNSIIPASTDRHSARSTAKACSSLVRGSLSLFVFTLFFTGFNKAEADTGDLLLYPVPGNLSYGVGSYTVSNGFLSADAGLSPVVISTVKVDLSNLAGVTLVDGVTSPKLSFAHDDSLHSQGYSLIIDVSGISINYKDDGAAFYATRTLKQLLFQCGAILPYVTIIDDYPDFPNRGYMWDISRNKIPTVATIKRVIDYMADLKCNQLQLYIEGYPFAYDSYPDVWKYATPLTPADFQEINTYCLERFVQFVPNQNSFGHMGGWLGLQQFSHLRESSTENSTIDLTNPESITFLENLYDDFLPNFTSEYFNVGADEIGVFEKSLIVYPDLSPAEIFIEGLKTIHGLATARNKKMMYWADIIVHYADTDPAIVQSAKDGLPDAVALDWGYEFDYDFESSTSKFKNAGIPYYVCPGTATWSSIIGRTSNMTENLENAADWGKTNNSIGYLLTTWGDQGHRQHLVCDYAPIAYAAGLSWNVDANKKEVFDYNQYVSRFIFKDTEETLAKKFSDLADYGAISPRAWNSNWISNIDIESYAADTSLLDFIRFQADSTEEERKASALSQAEQVNTMADTFLNYLSTVTINADDGTIVRAELENGARMLKAGADYAAMRLRIYNGVTTEAAEAENARILYDEKLLISYDFKNTWLMRNKYSALDHTLKFQYIPNAYYRHIMGGVSPLPDGNHVLITPDLLTLPLGSNTFFPQAYVWSPLSGGSGEPGIITNYLNNTAAINAAIADEVFSMMEYESGVEGKVFAYDPVVALANGYYSIWDGDPSGNTKMLPYFAWPVIFDGTGPYEISFKAKYKNAAVVNQNLSLGMTAVSVDGTLANINLANVSYSVPDANGWVSVKIECDVSDNMESASFKVNPLQSTNDTLYIAEIDMRPNIDLIVESISWSPANPVPGQAVTFSAVIKNIGTRASDGTFQTLTWDIAGQSFWVSTNDSIPAGGTLSLTATDGSAGTTWTATAGAVEVTSVVDVNNAIAESDETNNTATAYINGGPDLIVESISWSPENPTPGQEVTFSAVIKNIGTEATIEGAYHTTTWNVPGDGFWAGITTSIPAGGTFIVTADSGAAKSTWTATANTTEVTAVVDVSNGIAETDESNNTTISYVNGAPDLIVESISWSPVDPLPGEVVTFSAVIKNIGTEASDGTFQTLTWAIAGQSFCTPSNPGPQAALIFPCKSNFLSVNP